VGLARASSRKNALAGALASVAIFSALWVGTASAPALTPAPQPPAPCPSFRILHNDRIGLAVLPAGSYTLTVPSSTGLTCTAASSLFTRFLEDYDGVLPAPWQVAGGGGGKASFARGGQPSFSVALDSGGGDGDGELGALCKNVFTVNSDVVLGPVTFPKGQYLLYLPPRSGIGCNRAAVLFTRCLGSPGGRLPFPWRLKNQTATFFKPEHPTRSAFRVEPAAGASG
jgi:hypothetical protein